MGTSEIRSVYLSQIGQTEHPAGSNWGKPVQNYLAAVSYRKPAPWCAAFVRWCLDSAGIYCIITAAASSCQNKANLVYYQGKWRQPVQPGDVFTIYYVALHRIGHTGFVNLDLGNNMMETVEGNSNAGGSREGIGVFRRKRPLHTLWSISRWQ
jgi:hypothetical protein